MNEWVRKIEKNCQNDACWMASEVVHLVSFCTKLYNINIKLCSWCLLFIIVTLTFRFALSLSKCNQMLRTIGWKKVVDDVDDNDDDDDGKYTAYIHFCRRIDVQYMWEMKKIVICINFVRNVLFTESLLQLYFYNFFTLYGFECI